MAKRRTRYPSSKAWRPELSFNDATAEAKGIVGQSAKLRYDASRPRWGRCIVGVEFKDDTGQTVYGIVGSGPDWRSALDKAVAQAGEYQLYLKHKQTEKERNEQIGEGNHSSERERPSEGIPSNEQGPEGAEVPG